MPIPFTVTNALYMCWGLTLKLSHENQQQEFGKEYFSTIINKISSMRGIPKSFLSELLMILARTTRNMGFIRLAHVRHLEREAREYSELKELLSSISEISFSKDSIPLKIVSFFGFGGIIPNLLNLNPYKETLEDLKIASDIVNNATATIDIKQINDIIQRIFEFSQITFSVEQIFYFVLFGSIGIFVGSIGFKLLAHTYLKYKENKLRESQKIYWQNKYLEDMGKTLLLFYTDIKSLLKRYYNYTGDPDDPVTNPGLNVEKYIKEIILPNVHIDWDIWLSPQEKSTPVINSNQASSEDS